MDYILLDSYNPELIFIKELILQQIGSSTNDHETLRGGGGGGGVMMAADSTKLQDYLVSSRHPSSSGIFRKTVLGFFSD